MTDWQPIETAPRDGTEVLVGVWAVFDEWDDGEHRPPIWCAWVSCAGPGDDFGCEGWNGAPATHWQPLPEPPK